MAGIRPESIDDFMENILQYVMCVVGGEGGFPTRIVVSEDLLSCKL